MPSSGPETKLTNRALKWLNATDGMWWKVAGGRFQRGWPDISGVVDGHACFIEMKYGNGKATELQLKRLRDLYVAGAHTAVCWSMLEVQEFYTSIRDAHEDRDGDIVRQGF